MHITLQASLTANESILMLLSVSGKKTDVAELMLEVITTKYITAADAEMHRSCKYQSSFQGPTVNIDEIYTVLYIICIWY